MLFFSTIHNFLKFLAMQANSTYLASLRFTLDKNAASSMSVGGPNIIYRDLTIALQTTAVGSVQTIQSCFSLSSNMTSEDFIHLQEMNCLSFGGSYSQGTCTLPPTQQPEPPPQIPQPTSAQLAHVGRWTFRGPNATSPGIAACGTATTPSGLQAIFTHSPCATTTFGQSCQTEVAPGEWYTVSCSPASNGPNADNEGGGDADSGADGSSE